MSVERRYPLLKHSHNVSELIDINLDALDDGDTLVWDADTGTWVAVPPATGGGTDLLTVLTANGDLLTRAAGVLSRLGIGSSGQVLAVSGGAPVWGTLAASATTDVQTFTANGTWTKPAGAKLVYVYTVGGGAGAGSGRASISTSSAGGGGGMAGGRSEMVFAATMLPATVSVTVGAGGPGGTARAGNTDTNGAAGTNGGDSWFGTYVGAQGGDAGGGGSTGTGAPGISSSFGQGNLSPGLAGGTGQSTTSGSGAANSVGTSPVLHCTGGGGGGGCTTSANVARNGGVAGDVQWSLYDNLFNVAGGTGLTAAAGTAGFELGTGFVGGGGGGGGNGTSGNNISAGAGGNGGYPGGGGGGGGGYTGNNAAHVSGAGGNGGNGVVVVVSFFDGVSAGSGVGTTTGTFTGTLTGVSGTVTATIRYTKIGNLVFLHCAQLTGTSTSTACTITGLPSTLWPARLQRVTIDSVFDNSTYIGQPTYLRVETSGVLTLDITTVVGAGTFTASGTKGVNYGFDIIYSLD